MAAVSPGKLIIVTGPPGSGKSTLLNSKRQDLTGLIIHDFHKDAHNNSKEVRHSLHFRAVVEAVKAGHDCIIADIRFCETPRRNSVEHEFRQEGITKIEFIFFENDPEKCEVNIRTRNRPQRDQELEKLAELSPVYEIPPGTTALPVRTAK